MKDLHIHTKYSDGEYDEIEILNKIEEAHIKEFAICDHDTLEGSEKVYNLVKGNESLVFHSGVELSSRINGMYGGIDIHLLVRDFDYNDENIIKLINKIAYLRNLKIERMKKLVEEIYGIKLSEEELEAKKRTTNSFGKPHIYSLLLNHGEYDRETFYLKMRKLPASDLKLEAKEVLEMLKDSECYVTLAHPIEIMDEYKLTYEDIDRVVEYLCKCGLDGLETRHSKHSEEDYKKFSLIAKKYNLKETEGSDYHGPNVKPHVKLGVCVKEI